MNVSNVCAGVVAMADFTRPIHLIVNSWSYLVALPMLVA